MKDTVAKIEISILRVTLLLLLIIGAIKLLKMELAGLW